MTTHSVQNDLERYDSRIKLNQESFSGVRYVLIGRIFPLSASIPNHYVNNSPHASKVTLRVPESSTGELLHMCRQSRDDD